MTIYSVMVINPILYFGDPDTDIRPVPKDGDNISR